MLFKLKSILTLFVCACLIAGHGEAATRDNPRANVPKPRVHTDHSTFFSKPFADGPAVTRACLECHKNAAAEIMKTAHWNWVGDEDVMVPGHDTPVRIGKKNLMNNYCIGIQSNWVRCTQCHAGYGWEDDTFDFSKQDNVDCLVCHDRTTTYNKDPNGAGRPDPKADLLAIAKSVGYPKRANCGYCHFAGGGGDAVKHGDMDGSLLNPRERIDIHMSRHKLECIDCHQTKNHLIPGRLISVSVDAKNRFDCTLCHASQPHKDMRLNAHGAAVACQTCHIPRIAPEEATKMSWDWSQAGDIEREKAVNDPHQYAAIKGVFEYAVNIAPEYAWFNGTADHYLLGETIDPETVTAMAKPMGSIRDGKARIWPFKVHRGKQIYDLKNRYFIVPKTYGPGGYWKDFDWDKAARLGSEATGLSYSGEFGFAPTEMYWAINHMVVTSRQALSCKDCHGQGGRLNWEALGYDGDPAVRGGRQRTGMLETETAGGR